MLNIGITGQVGFIGTHLYNSLALSSEKYNLIEFRDEYFDSSEHMEIIKDSLTKRKYHQSIQFG